MAEFRYVANESGLRDILTSAHGPVMKTLARIGVTFESISKEYASGENGGPNVDTGNLRSSITYELGVDSEGAYVECGTNVEYAIFLELGTRYMSARKFIEPAARAAVREVLGA